MKFKKGDRVKVIAPYSRFYGATGTVVEACCGINYGIVSVSIYIAPGIKHDVTFGVNDLMKSNVVYEPKLKGETDDYERRITQMSRKNSIPEIRNVYFNNPLTCVIWKDGTKTFVKNADGDNNYDPEKALAMAIAKKALGNNYNYYKEFKKWLPEENEEASMKDVLEAAEELRKSLKSLGTATKITLTKNPVEKAYLTLLKANDDPTSTDTDFAVAIEEAIGYLGEALDD